MFGVSWDEFLVTNYDLIIVYFDARGCGYYGDKYVCNFYDVNFISDEADY